MWVYGRHGSVAESMFLHRFSCRVYTALFLLFFAERIDSEFHVSFLRLPTH